MPPVSQPPNDPPQEPGPPPGPPPGPGWGPPPGQWGPPPGQPGYGAPPGQPPYAQGPYAQQPYGAQYGYPYARQTEGLAIAVLVLAIASFVVCPVVPAIVALALAPGAKRNIAQSGGMKDGEGLVTAGQIVAWINLGFAALGLIALIILVAVADTSNTNAFVSALT